ncbi:MAG: 50S ribosomal protein L23 [Candidatus Enteromonas sp.]|jgi:large subunit ribosomal protein L23|nr:50S ribosomal protein L23 [Bacilli bacterium]MEE3298684.1 50S ribosomal protein L23 [Candidatus Enteromonas sp.]MBQ2052545.1 50S ribosomal protein L23 [Bacilli bacterium]MBQ4182050.1 50S ribosomal protein L23 [Bacilli bacterium]MEE3402031.1 50S ribosomal protein L23 [Candidatus Enteromonas sp.]
MAEEKIVEAVAEEKKAPAKKKAAPKKAAAKKEEVKAEAKKFAKATTHDFEVILEPVITEKSMALMQNSNKVTVRVSAKANKTEIKLAFQRLYQVAVTDVKVVNVPSKTTTRGGRYQGTISGFKKAVITVKSGEAIDLFKE